MINICEECRQDPCHPLCPNAPPLKIITHCRTCNSSIREGDEYIKSEDYGDFCDDYCFVQYCKMNLIIIEEIAEKEM